MKKRTLIFCGGPMAGQEFDTTAAPPIYGYDCPIPVPGGRQLTYFYEVTRTDGDRLWLQPAPDQEKVDQAMELLTQAYKERYS